MVVGRRPVLVAQRPVQHAGHDLLGMRLMATHDTHTITEIERGLQIDCAEPGCAWYATQTGEQPASRTTLAAMHATHTRLERERAS